MVFCTESLQTVGLLQKFIKIQDNYSAGGGRCIVIRRAEKEERTELPVYREKVDMYDVRLASMAYFYKYCIKITDIIVFRFFEPYNVIIRNCFSDFK